MKALARQLLCVGAAFGLGSAALGLGSAATAAAPARVASPTRARVAPLRPAVALHGGASAFRLARSDAHGIVRRRGGAGRAGVHPLAAPLSEPCLTACSGPLLYHELEGEPGAVMPRAKVYLIQWEPPEPANNGQAGTHFEKLPAGYLTEVETYIKDVAAASGTLGNVFSVDTLYGETPVPGQPPGAGAYRLEFGGAFKDEDSYPERQLSTCPTPTTEDAALPPKEQPCISDGYGPSKTEEHFQLSAEVLKFIGAHPALSTELEALYVMLTPNEVNSCSGFEGGVAACNTNVFCAYHSAFGFKRGGTSHIAVYANMPYDNVSGCETPDHPRGSPADSEIDVLSHETNESITDPLGNAWFDIGGNEVADKCTSPFFDPLIDFNPSADAYGPLLGGTLAEFSGTEELTLVKVGTAYNQLINGDHYFTQREWSNVAGGCVTQAPVPVASFAVYSTPAVTGATVSFNGASSSPAAGTLSEYRWEFGDGESVSGAERAAVTHVYRAAGVYPVRLTVINNSGATAETSHAVTVEEPAPAQTTTVTVPGPTTTVTTPGSTTTVTTPSPTTTVTTPSHPSSVKIPACPSSSQHASPACRHTRRPAATPKRPRRCGSRATSRHGRRCPRSGKRSSARSRR